MIWKFWAFGNMDMIAVEGMIVGGNKRGHVLNSFPDGFHDRSLTDYSSDGTNAHRTGITFGAEKNREILTTGKLDEPGTEEPILSLLHL
jgi:hypothetical protein